MNSDLKLIQSCKSYRN